MPKVGLRKSPNGDLWVESYRLFAFRVYRALEAAAFIIDQGGEAPFESLSEPKRVGGGAPRAYGAPLPASGAAERRGIRAHGPWRSVSVRFGCEAAAREAV